MSESRTHNTLRWRLNTVPINSIKPSRMFSPFIALMNEITVNIICCFSTEKKNLFNAKVKTDFYKAPSMDEKSIMKNKWLHKYSPLVSVLVSIPNTHTHTQGNDTNNNTPLPSLWLAGIYHLLLIGWNSAVAQRYLLNLPKKKSLLDKDRWLDF